MVSIADKLKSLGVQVRAEKIKAPQKKYPIETVINGQFEASNLGESFVFSKPYSLTTKHGNFGINFSSSLTTLSRWAKYPEIALQNNTDLIFLDTETTGLAGGSGTYAFEIGVGKYEEDKFVMKQFFMRNPGEEIPMLLLLEKFVKSGKTIVSFNGKSFDIPLLNTRYTVNGLETPFTDMPHIDLLHLARKIWKDRLPSRTLGYLEEHIVGEKRTSEDTPGWMIPQMYFDYLKSGDARPLAGIFYHNEMDIVTLAVLTNLLGNLIEKPLVIENPHPVDVISVAQLREDIGDWDEAVLLFQHGLTLELPNAIQQRATERLAVLHRRRDEWPKAVSLWWQAAADRHIYAHVSLAKFYEHQAKEFQEALRWTEAALALINQPETTRLEKFHWEEALLHRLGRLERKIENISST
jgi:uncharacterized protein